MKWKSFPSENSSPDVNRIILAQLQIKKYLPLFVIKIATKGAMNVKKKEPVQVLTKFASPTSRNTTVEGLWAIRTALVTTWSCRIWLTCQIKQVTGRKKIRKSYSIPCGLNKNNSTWYNSGPGYIISPNWLQRSQIWPRLEKTN